MQKLAYCGLGVADVSAFKDFAVEGLGLMPETVDGVQRFRLDEKSWRLALHPTGEDDIIYAGIDMGTAAALDAAKAKLEAEGIAFEILDAATCAARQVEQGVSLVDPDGLRLELVIGHADAATPFASPLVSGFCTGDQGLGHIVLGVSDLDRSLAFFAHLGFALSDFITASMGPHQIRVAFLHCNPRHHSLAMAAMPGKRLNHIMVEVNEVDAVLQARRRCVERGAPTGEIGRHPNDEMLSFYVTTPAGFDIEYGWGGRVVGPDWQVVEYDQFSLWGHERPAPALQDG